MISRDQVIWIQTAESRAENSNYYHNWLTCRLFSWLIKYFFSHKTSENREKCPSQVVKSQDNFFECFILSVTSSWSAIWLIDQSLQLWLHQPKNGK